MKERSGMPYDVVAFSTDERAMSFTLEEEGAFHRLMRHAWINGSLPDNSKKLSEICRISEKYFKKLWPSIEPMWPVDPVNPSRRINPKQETEREFKLDKSQKAHDSSVVRWTKEREKKALGERERNAKAECERNANAMRTHTERNAVAILPSPSLPSPPLPDPVPIHVPNSEISTVPTQRANGNPKTNGNGNGRSVKTPGELLKLWAPTYAAIRRNIDGEVFARYYEGMELRDLTADYVLIAIPKAFQAYCERYGILPAAELQGKIESTFTDLLRNRPVRIIPLESDEVSA